ncbi:O-antigen polysaccharide polymerase Wzy [Listeria monocytogenes]|nr:O-antigen polysaccharide polymerase Wzy [Listeria monocytogenes]
MKVNASRFLVKVTSALFIHYPLLSLLVFSVAVACSSIQLDTSKALLIYGVGAFLLIICLNIIKIQKFGPAYTIILYTIVTHFGYPIVYLIQGNELLIQITSNRHLYVQYLPHVLALSFIGCYSFIIGWQFKQKIRISNNKPKRLTTSNLLDKQQVSPLEKYYLIISTSMIFAFCIILTINVLQGNLLSVGYAGVKDWLATRPLLAYMQRMFWVSLIPVVVFKNKRFLKLNMIPVCIILVLLLLTGNRNDILYPLAIAFSLYCLVNKVVPKLPLLIGVIILFVINPAIAASRKEAGISLHNLSWGFSDAIIEMGGQVNPFSIIFYLVHNGLEFTKGLTIILPSISILNLNLFYSTSDYLNSIYYVPKLLASLNHFGQAFSMIGEMYLNFGIIGIIVCFCLYGFFANRIENKSLTGIRLVFYGQFSVLMMLWVRNSLMFNITILLFSLLLYLISWFSHQILGKRSKGLLSNNKE